MARTNFGELTDEQLTMWSRTMWRDARNMSFLERFTGTGPNSVIQRITDLKKGQKGSRAVMTLIADLTGTGVVGDNTLEGREEQMQSFEQVIQIDQIRNGVRMEGVMADQASVVNFREAANSNLAYWLANSCDEMGLLTLAGVSYRYRSDGSLRPVPSEDEGRSWVELDFASDVSAPTGGRWRRWVDSSKSLLAGATDKVAAADKLSYQTLVNLKTYAHRNFIKGIRMRGNEEMYYLFVTPEALRDLLLDADVQKNLQQAGPRGDSNRLWSGISNNSIVVDGVHVIAHRLVPNTLAATSGLAANKGAAGYKWGATADLDGAMCLFCGAQAMGIVDFSGPTWNEEKFDYKNQGGISIGKITGLLKPKFNAAPRYTTQEDFGVVRLDVAAASAG